MLLLFSTNLFSQSIGVVLSGGGAKGIYHVGLLKALEENNIPIDYISGTSMGAIVAGLYASGYTIAEIEAIVCSPDIEKWVSGKIDPKYNYFYNKLPNRPSMINFDLDVNTLFKSKKKKDTTKIIPSESHSVYYNKETSSKNISILVPSTQLDIGLMQYFSGPNAASKNDFDSLYIPFRCLSIDAVTKSQYVWEKGELSQAIRSSMAIPIVFSPVIIDTAIMFDGGVYNNFPWKETLKAWPVDFIIGGKCVSGQESEITSTLGQAMALMTRPTDYNIPDSIGIVIGRSVDVGVLDFSKSKQVIETGYQDALAMMPTILKKIKRRVSAEERDAKRLKFKTTIPTLIFDREHLDRTLAKNHTIDSVKISKLNKKDTLSKIKKQKGVKNNDAINDNPVELEEFKHKYFRVMTEGTAKSEFPFAHYNDTIGKFDFDVKINRTPLLKIKAGLNISSASINQGYLGVSYVRNKKISSFYSLDGYLGAFYSAAQISTRFNFYNKPTHLYLYNTFTYNFYNYSKANNQRYSYNNLFASGQNKLNEFYVSSLLGMPIGVRTKMEVRLATGFDDFFFVETQNELETKLKASVYFLNLNYNISSSTLNDLMYPTDGFFQEFSLTGTYTNNSLRRVFSASPTPEKSDNYWASIRYSREQYFNLGKHFSLGYKVDGIYSTGPGISNELVNNYMSPRYAPTQFTKTIFIPEFQKQSYLGAGIIPILKLNQNFFLKTEFYGFWGDFTKTKDIKDNLSYIFATTLVYKLPFAPISLSYNRIGVESVKKNYVMFNIGFMLFNPRGVVY